MSALPNAQKSRSVVEAFLQWCREWAGSASELRCCADEEIERLAHDAGVSVAEFHKLVSKGPELADLLRRRMAALALDEPAVARIEPQTLHDLQRVCTMCASHRRCARDLAHDTANPVWKDYCPNAETLAALTALPEVARSGDRSDRAAL